MQGPLVPGQVLGPRAWVWASPGGGAVVQRGWAEAEAELLQLAAGY